MDHSAGVLGSFPRRTQLGRLRNSGAAFFLFSSGADSGAGSGAESGAESGADSGADSGACFMFFPFFVVVGASHRWHQHEGRKHRCSGVASAHWRHCPSDGRLHRCRLRVSGASTQFLATRWLGRCVCVECREIVSTTVACTAPKEITGVMPGISLNSHPAEAVHNTGRKPCVIIGQAGPRPGS